MNKRQTKKSIKIRVELDDYRAFADEFYAAWKNTQNQIPVGNSDQDCKEFNVFTPVMHVIQHGLDKKLIGPDKKKGVSL